ncbi:hypothetical protein GCM10027600_34980 [Nocardioides ginsengisegetis]
MAAGSPGLATGSVGVVVGVVAGCGCAAHWGAGGVIIGRTRVVSPSGAGAGAEGGGGATAVATVGEGAPATGAAQPEQKRWPSKTWVPQWPQ